MSDQPARDYDPRVDMSGAVPPDHSNDSITPKVTSKYDQTRLKAQHLADFNARQAAIASVSDQK